MCIGCNMEEGARNELISSLFGMDVAERAAKQTQWDEGTGEPILQSPIIYMGIQAMPGYL